MNNDDLERFMSLVEKDDKTGCWKWVGSLDSCGYGRFSFNGVNRKAANVIYEHNFGSTWLDILHKCLSKSCVNPEHLYTGDHSDNMKQRALEKTNPLQKITVEDVMQIKTRIDGGEMLKTIAESFGVTISTISAIKTGKRWGWVKPYGTTEP